MTGLPFSAWALVVGATVPGLALAAYHTLRYSRIQRRRRTSKK